MTAGDSTGAMKQLRYLAAALKAPRITWCIAERAIGVITGEVGHG